MNTARVVKADGHAKGQAGEHRVATNSPAMNSTRDIRAVGDARVQIGNSYVTNNYRDPSPDPSLEKEKTRTEFLRRLFTSPYEDRKNRNPKRADGTCEWFTAHELFRNWQQEISALLWVSADPGCGKSVLARHLVDDVCPSTATRTTCYFFFKDDFDDQKALESAICCLLHQLFVQKPALLSDDILEDFREEGDQLFTSFHSLWDILIRAASDHTHGEIICVLDALDECVGQTQLAATLTQLYSKANGLPTLKFLVTSRLHLRIQREFQDLKESQPTIHLSGESPEEVEKIAQEIIISIKQRTEEICRKLQFSMEEKQILQEELAAVDNRTYLWVHLVFAVIEEAVLLNKDDLRASIRALPHTVEEAYDKILCKSQDPVKTKKILQIVVAADRPLRLTEMAVLLAFQQGHRCHKHLEQGLLPPDYLHRQIREACGLFITVKDSEIFLLHQTAKEFLLSTSPVPSESHSHSLKWRHSLDPKESHSLISDVCIRYLLLTDLEKLSSTWKSSGELRFPFLDYASSNWAAHYRQVYNTMGRDIESLALQLCQTNASTCRCWLKVYGEERRRQPEFVNEFTSSLLVASYFGFNNLVDLILQENKESLNTRSPSSKRTALSWASENGHNLVVKSLLGRLPKHKVILRDWLQFPTAVNQKDELGKTPLWYAAANGHQNIVQQLLEKGGKVDARDDNGLTALSWATHHGYNDIVALLIKNGARRKSEARYLETRDRYRRTPLIKAAKDGNDVVAQLLLDHGATIDGTDKNHRTALMWASQHGHNATVKLLLDCGAAIDATDDFGWTALIWASRHGYNAIVKLLVDCGAAIDATDNNGKTALMVASLHGYKATAKLLLDYGAIKK
jgi:ankyrin repeat domain-containing protein 50